MAAHSWVFTSAPPTGRPLWRASWWAVTLTAQSWALILASKTGRLLWRASRWAVTGGPELGGYFGIPDRAVTLPSEQVAGYFGRSELGYVDVPDRAVTSASDQVAVTLAA